MARLLSTAYEIDSEMCAVNRITVEQMTADRPMQKPCNYAGLSSSMAHFSELHCVYIYPSVQIGSETRNEGALLMILPQIR